MANLSKELIDKLTPLKSATHVSGLFLKDRPYGTTRPLVIPTLYATNERGNNPQSSWSSSDYWTSFYTYLNSANDCERAAFNAVGDYYFSGGTDFTYNSKSYNNTRLEFSKRNRSGFTIASHFTQNNNTSYGPWGSRIMFIKNRGTTTKTVSVWAQMSSYWSSGHDGAGWRVGIPNTSGYAGVTSLTWSNLGQYTGSTWNWTTSGSFSLPANTTAVVLACNTFQYWTSFPSGGHWQPGNQFYNLDSTFSDPDIVPDLKLTHTAYMAGDWNRFTSSTSNQFAAHWPLCAEIFGENAAGEVIW